VFVCSRCRQQFDTNLAPRPKRCTNILKGDEACGGKLVREDKMAKQQSRYIQRPGLAAKYESADAGPSAGEGRTRRGLKKKDKGGVSLDLLMLMLGALLAWVSMVTF
ncbi:MAG: hypothetical protein ACXABY_18580, partial [Candidatus Thorarchaeota archaeon]